MPDWIRNRFDQGLVSVIIPTYNRADYLDASLQSVWEQTYRPIECIVVDDGSTDDTCSVLEKYKKLEDESIKLKPIQQKNAGAPTARNFGTAVSKGEFIQYLDSDDLLYAEKLSSQVAYLKEHKACDCVFGDWDRGQVDNRELVRAYKSENFVKQIFTIERPIVNFSFLMRRSLVVKTGPWDTSLKRMQEIDFQLKSLMAGGKFSYQAFTCGLWRHHAGERIHNQTTVKDMVPFFQKWENILVREQLFRQEMGEKIADWYMWFISQSKMQKTQVLLPVLEEAVRLNPSIAFYVTRRMKLLRTLFGKKPALYIWLHRYRHT